MCDQRRSVVLCGEVAALEGQTEARLLLCARPAAAAADLAAETAVSTDSAKGSDAAEGSTTPARKVVIGAASRAEKTAAPPMRAVDEVPVKDAAVEENAAKRRRTAPAVVVLVVCGRAGAEGRELQGCPRLDALIVARKGSWGRVERDRWP